MSVIEGNVLSWKTLRTISEHKKRKIRFDVSRLEIGHHEAIVSQIFDGAGETKVGKYARDRRPPPTLDVIDQGFSGWCFVNRTCRAF